MTFVFCFTSMCDPMAYVTYFEMMRVTLDEVVIYFKKCRDVCVLPQDECV